MPETTNLYEVSEVSRLKLESIEKQRSRKFQAGLTDPPKTDGGELDAVTSALRENVDDFLL